MPSEQLRLREAPGPAPPPRRPRHRAARAGPYRAPAGARCTVSRGGARRRRARSPPPRRRTQPAPRSVAACRTGATRRPCGNRSARKCLPSATRLTTAVCASAASYTVVGVAKRRGSTGQPGQQQHQQQPRPSLPHTQDQQHRQQREQPPPPNAQSGPAQAHLTSSSPLRAARSRPDPVALLTAAIVLLAIVVAAWLALFRVH